MAVRQIEDLAQTGQGDAFGVMVQSAVAQTGRFQVVERDIANLVAEQQDANAGLVTTNTPGRVGGFEGADYLIYGTITAASAGRERDTGAEMGNAVLGRLSGGLLNGGGRSCSRATATLAVDVKITDSATGEIRFARSLTQNSETATDCGGDASLDTTAMLRSVADQIASGLVMTVYPIQIATVQSDGTLMLNYGDTALTPGMIMTVYEPQQDIPDPAQPDVMIRIDGAKLGIIEVTEVTPRFSRARMLSEFAASPAAGSVVREASPEDASQYRRRRR